MNNDQVMKEVQADIGPMLDMFGGADGGAGFTKFRHTFCPQVYAMNTPEAIEFKRMMKRMAQIANLMMNKP